MKRSAKANSVNVSSAATPGVPTKQRVAKRSRKQSRTGTKGASGNKIEPSAAKTPRLSSGIREAEEARALLENQLHSLYWWVFNACKMKGFIRAKALDELQRRSATGDETHVEQGDLTDDHVSPETQTS